MPIYDDSAHIFVNIAARRRFRPRHTITPQHFQSFPRAMRRLYLPMNGEFLLLRARRARVERSPPLRAMSTPSATPRGTASLRPAARPPIIEAPHAPMVERARISRVIYDGREPSATSRRHDDEAR